MTRRVKSKHSGGGFDRRAVMRDAHKRYRDGKRLSLGWTYPTLSRKQSRVRRSEPLLA
jgi:hypothetical protein